MRIAALLILLMAGYELAAAAEWTVERAESTFLGKHYESIVTAASLNESPKWEDEEGPPPLTPPKAARLAESAAHAKLGNHPSIPSSDERGWRAIKIALTKHHGLGWYYRVEVIPVIPGTGGREPVTIFVMMGGKALPLAEKEEPK